MPAAPGLGSIPTVAPMTGWPVYALVVALTGCLGPWRLAAPLSSAPGLIPPHSPWAVLSPCGFMAINQSHRVIIGTANGQMSEWHEVPDLGEFADIHAAAETEGAGTLAIAISLTGETWGNRMEVRCDDGRVGVRSTPVGSGAMPAAVLFGDSAFLVRGADLVVAGDCAHAPGLCVGPAVVPDEPVRGASPGLGHYRAGVLTDRTRAMFIATRYPAPPVVMEISAGDTLLAVPYPLSTGLSYPPSATGADERCEADVVPPSAPSGRSLPVVVTCRALATGSASTSIVTLRIGGDGALDIRREVASAIPDEQAALIRTYFASASWDSRSVASGDTTWLIAANQERGGDIFAVCVRSGVLGPLQKLTSVAPIGLGIGEDGDLTLMDATQVRTIVCAG